MKTVTFIVVSLMIGASAFAKGNGTCTATSRGGLWSKTNRQVSQPVSTAQPQGVRTAQ